MRMRTNHCLTKTHLHRIGRVEEPYCECGQIETLDQIFFECPINKISQISMYETFIKLGITAPLCMTTVLSNITHEILFLISNRGNPRCSAIAPEQEESKPYVCACIVLTSHIVFTMLR